MKLSEMKQVLAEDDIRLTKSLGQNFLHDANQLRRIVAAAELTRSDKILEIGPGLGPLTELLLAEAGEVLAIEKDRRLVEVLRRRFNTGPEAPPSREPPASPDAPANRAGHACLRLLHDDALDFLKRNRHDWHEWKLVANLPYSVASPLLVELALAERGPRRIVTTLQIEVARRLVAKAGDQDYGAFTLLVQLDYEPHGWFKIPAGCFFPEPEVDSACVILARRAQPLLPYEQRATFVKVVKRGFSQRRKMMHKLLKTDWPADTLARAFEQLEQLRLPFQARAEMAALEHFVLLTRLLAPIRPVNEEIFDVVNEQDQVIGRQPRREVHRLGLMHRATHVLVFNFRGEVFLQKRSMKKDRQPGLWDSSASGHVDSGEDYDTCASRELFEELGLKPNSAPRRLFKLPASTETDQEHVWVYRCEAEGPFTLHPDEIERGGWFAPEMVTRWMAERPADFASALLVIWPKVLFGAG